MLNFLLFLAGQKRCANLLGKLASGSLTAEGTGEVWKAHLKQSSCVHDNTPPWASERICIVKDF